MLQIVNVRPVMEEEQMKEQKWGEPQLKIPVLVSDPKRNKKLIHKMLREELGRKTQKLLPVVCVVNTAALIATCVILLMMVAG